MSSARQRFIGILIQTVLVWAVFALLSQTAVGRRLELLGFDFLTVMTTPASIDAPIVIVGIDEPSFAELDRQWPWPRGIHADLVDRLKEAGAKAIAFDVLFAEPAGEEGDRRLAEAIRRAGNVVLASDLVYQEAGQFQMAMQVEPIPLLREAGARSGLASITIDSDLVVRAIPQHPDAFWRQILLTYMRDNARPDASPVDLPGGLVRRRLRQLGIGIAAVCVAGRYVAVRAYGVQAFAIHWVDWEIPYRLTIYPLVAASQELLIKGILQTSLEQLLFRSRHATFASVAISATLFAGAHAIAGFWCFVGILAYAILTGLFYARSRSLVGVAVIHYVAGLGLMSFTPY